MLCVSTGNIMKPLTFCLYHGHKYVLFVNEVFEIYSQRTVACLFKLKNLQNGNNKNYSAIFLSY